MNKIYNWFIRRRMYIYLSTLLLLIFTQLITITVVAQMWKFEKIFKLLRYLCYFVLVFLACESFYRKVLHNSLKGMIRKTLVFFKEHILLLLFILASFTSMLVSKEMIPLILFLLIVNASEYDFDETLHLIIILNVIVFLLTVLGGYFGFLPDVIITRGDTIRHSYGYIYPTEFLSHYCFIVLMYIYLKKDQFGIKDFFLSNIFNFIFFKMSDSRLDFLIILFATGLGLLFSCRPGVLKKIAKSIYVNGILLFSILISFISSVFYNGNSSLFSKLNQLLSQRLLLGNNALSYYGLKMFGQKIEWIGSGGSGIYRTFDQIDYNYVDCSYLQYALSFGIVFMLVMILLYMLAIKHEYLENRNYSLFIFAVIFVISIIEPRLLNIQMNPFILLLGSIIMLSNKEILKLIKGERKNGTV
ncbi:hypothetical protein [Sharpea azabuensis]|uniref:hypothetical protein n=1 Tax=Sharpea azabuensis TaxID=322505 RepID=UPI00156AF38D|nr:hypothetical protein [Sharpea azabuensis]